tara:strand:- start:127 stop:1296 length:1170 start_codon:yes stop_codon:yes gene_type:complete
MDNHYGNEYKILIVTFSIVILCMLLFKQREIQETFVDCNASFGSRAGDYINRNRVTNDSICPKEQPFCQDAYSDGRFLFGQCKSVNCYPKDGQYFACLTDKNWRPNNNQQCPTKLIPCCRKLHADNRRNDSNNPSTYADDEEYWACSNKWWETKKETRFSRMNNEGQCDNWQLCNKQKDYNHTNSEAFPFPKFIYLIMHFSNSNTDKISTEDRSSIRYNPNHKLIKYIRESNTEVAEWYRKNDDDLFNVAKKFEETLPDSYKFKPLGRILLDKNIQWENTFPNNAQLHRVLYVVKFSINRLLNEVDELKESEGFNEGITLNTISASGKKLNELKFTEDGFITNILEPFQTDNSSTPTSTSNNKSSYRNPLNGAPEWPPDLPDCEGCVIS